MILWICFHDFVVYKKFKPIIKSLFLAFIKHKLIEEMFKLSSINVLNVQYSMKFLTNVLYDNVVSSSCSTLCAIWSWFQAKHDNCCQSSPTTSQF